MDAVVGYWLSQVVREGSEITGLGQTVVKKFTIFYADNGLVVAGDHEWLQHAIDVLSGLFEQVGLWMNIKKTKCMSCMPGHIRALSNLHPDRFSFKLWTKVSKITL